MHGEAVIKFFGPMPWGLALDEPNLMTSTPVGTVCDHCGEPIAAGDWGTIIPQVGADGEPGRSYQHRECTMRGIFGSVGHQQGRCSCFGGTEEDPPGMTKRQAALAAVKTYLLANGVRLR